MTLVIGFMYNRGSKYRRSLNGREFKYSLPIRLLSTIILNFIGILGVIGLKTILNMGLNIYHYRYISVSSSVVLPAIIDAGAFLIGIFIIVMAGICIFFSISVCIGSIFMFILEPECKKNKNKCNDKQDNQDEWKEI